ncbi:MAG: ATP-binding protein [Lachnospiraceae bacterium]|nr:ATP-binding protein [Lachnospiraceae bacterium]
MRNPFAINFGMIPNERIERKILIDEIVSEFTSDTMQNPCYMITGVRGTGKTVTLTEIEKEISKEDKWIIIRLNSSRDILSSLVGKLYDSHEFICNFIDANINLSKFGIGVSLSSKSPVSDIESALEIILKEIKRQKYRLLVTIDEVSNTPSMREFASTYQIMIREELPFYLIMAGLYKNIHDLENEDNLTFLYRTPKLEMKPLNITRIRDRYSKIFNIASDKAMEMALITKGYAFAYQALGKYLWESKNHELSDTVLYYFDEALSHYVYEKIWSELSAMDRKYMQYIVTKEEIDVSEVLKLASCKPNVFSQYRKRLSEKGLIDTSQHGKIKFTLPRFDVFVQNQLLLS